MSILNAVLFALAAFAGSFFVIGAAWLLGRDRAASVRHLIWTGAFAILLALPLAALVLPSQLTYLLPAASAAAPIDGSVIEPAPDAAGFDLADVVLAVAAVWLAGVLFHVARLAIGGIGLFRLYRKSVAHIPRGIADTPFRGLSWQLRLRTSPSDAGPLTWGLLRPVVLLPKASVAWPRERLMSVLLHEAAHVRRKDCLCRLIATAASALYWPNPLIWLAARAMRADAESAADDAVLMAGVKPTQYAEHLVGLAREFSGLSFAISLSMAERRMLDGRVEAILDPDQPRSGVTKMDVLKLGVAAVALTAGLALVRPSLAEEPAPPAQTPAAPHHAPASPQKHITGTVTVEARPHQIVVRSDDGSDPEPPDMADAPSPPPVPPVPPVAEVPPPPLPWTVPLPHPVPPTNVLTRAFVPHDKAQAEARRAMAEARRALAQINIDRTVEAAMKQAEKAMRDAKIGEAEAKKALARMKLDRIVAKAMRKAEIAMQKAEAAQARAAHRGVIIEGTVTSDYVVTDTVARDQE